MFHVTQQGPNEELMGRQSSTADRVRRHRAALRAAGMRPVQIWVPDVRARTFAGAARRQSRLVAESATADGDQAFIDAISTDPVP